MLADRLFQRWPKPAFAVAVHDTNNLPAGKVGYVPGFALSATDSLDVTIHGKGGHGASPQSTVDPIVIAARTILALRTIISREVDPQEAAVITVGSVHAGTKDNIIPDEEPLQITVRSFKPVHLGPCGPRKLMKIAESQDTWERLGSGEVEVSVEQLRL